MHSFTNFKNQLQRAGRQIKDDVIKGLESAVESLMFKEDNLVDLLIKMEDMYAIEQFFHECIFVNMIYAKIYDTFSFHFFTQKETNRLDKPEWYFKFLLDQLDKYKFVCACYDSVVLENKKSKINKNVISQRLQEGFLEENELKSNERSMNSLIERIYSIVEIKLNELRKCKSGQKRNLLLHFTEEYLVFKRELREKYSVNFNIMELADNIMRVQKGYIANNLHEIHCGDSKEWFESYQKIYKENFFLAFSYVSLQNNIFNDLIDFISSLIVEYQEVFIDKMSFVGKEEKRMLCFLVVGIDKLKNFLRLEESLFILQLENKTVDFNVEILKNIHIDTLKFIDFNNSNIKLLKTIAYHEISQVLVNLMYFNGITKKSLVQSCSELSKIMTFYNEQLGPYKILTESYIFDKIDNFIIDKIVLQNRFDSDVLFMYKDLVQRIMHMCEKKTDWMCLKACKNLEDIFNGVTEGDSLFKKIYAVYR
ncbi:ER to golgi transport protein/RAD50-interacting protein 1 [Trachipleistophora hominis]|uniref:ER to golgi transport protein/RAD50-interacting protein 1 n=1 Tax=Trachipleistophora hominis TaxID=72359 RepID=L7JYY4_TRAHO|nr:ER to golgi transport protein/RAD50-interacting protein 1 [Trachipleistophora hominis]